MSLQARCFAVSSNPGSVMLAIYRHIYVLQIERGRLPLVLQEGSSIILVMLLLLPGAANRGTTTTLASNSGSTEGSVVTGGIDS